MNKCKLSVLFTCILIFASSWGQSRNSVDEDLNLSDPKNKIYNVEELERFFTKVKRVIDSKEGKINIVHIGDSHIQADFFSGKMRVLLQDKFGNGGLGFAFPYKLAKTNGNSLIRYSSNADWQSYRNIFPVKDAQVGLSGIALSTESKNAVIELSVRDASYGFSRMKVFTPSNNKVFNVGTSDQKVFLESTVPQRISHQIKRGESLGVIANKYNTTITEIKKANNMKTNTIHAGKRLSIPTQKKEKKSIVKDMFNELSGEQKDVFYTFELGEELDRIYFYSNEQAESYDLNGVVLENNKPGVLYHTIGVNGARFSDYLKYDLFFKQLKGLEADLIIVSMGTNESFDRMSAQDFKVQVNKFLNKVRTISPNSDILLTTPPPSYFSRNNPNTVAAQLSNEIVVNGVEENYAVWDTYYNLGSSIGLPTLREKGLLSKDLVHYTVKGYELTGDLFYEALIRAYDQFVEQKSAL